MVHVQCMVHHMDIIDFMMYKYLLIKMNIIKKLKNIYKNYCLYYCLYYCPYNCPYYFLCSSLELQTIRANLHIELRA